MPDKAKLLKLIDDLLAEGEEVLKTTYDVTQPADPPSEHQPNPQPRVFTYLEEGTRKAWAMKLRLLKTVSADLIKPWEPELKYNGVVAVVADFRDAMAALRVIRYAVEGDYLAGEAPAAPGSPTSSP